MIPSARSRRKALDVSQEETTETGEVDRRCNRCVKAFVGERKRCCEGEIDIVAVIAARAAVVDAVGDLADDEDEEDVGSDNAAANFGSSRNRFGRVTIGALKLLLASGLGLRVGVGLMVC